MGMRIASLIFMCVLALTACGGGSKSCDDSGESAGASKYGALKVSTGRNSKGLPLGVDTISLCNQEFSRYNYYRNQIRFKTGLSSFVAQYKNCPAPSGAVQTFNISSYDQPYSPNEVSVSYRIKQGEYEVLYVTSGFYEALITQEPSPYLEVDREGLFATLVAMPARKYYASQSADDAPDEISISGRLKY